MLEHVKLLLLMYVIEFPVLPSDTFSNWWLVYFLSSVLEVPCAFLLIPRAQINDHAHCLTMVGKRLPQ